MSPKSLGNQFSFNVFPEHLPKNEFEVNSLWFPKGLPSAGDPSGSCTKVESSSWALEALACVNASPLSRWKNRGPGPTADQQRGSASFTDRPSELEGKLRLEGADGGWGCSRHPQPSGAQWVPEAESKGLIPNLSGPDSYLTPSGW